MQSRHAFLVLLCLASGSSLVAQQAPPPPPFDERAVQQRPERVPSSCATLSYPDSLQSAGFEGRVVVQFVVDTTGRAEPSSVRVLSATHPGFEGPARAAVLSCRYLPGRISGRAVRVRVVAPVNFTLPRRAPGG